MVPALNTNAYLLTRAHIEGFNASGLYAMQISIDNVRPNAVSKKSLRPLQPKLQLLAQLATFRVRINTVLGSGPADESLEVAKAAIAYGFDAKCALLRDPSGQLAKLDAHTRAVYDQITKLQGRHLGLLSEDFNDKILRDGKLTGNVELVRDFFTSAKMAWCIGARHVMAHRPNPSRRIPSTISAWHSSRKNRALRNARWPMRTKPAAATHGAAKPKPRTASAVTADYT